MRVLLFIFLLFPITSFSQTQIKVDSVVKVKGNSIYCTGIAAKTGERYYFYLNFKGMGRKPEVVGLWVTHYPEGIGRRKVKFVINN